MVTAADTFTWEDHEDLLKDYLGVLDAAEDDQLQPWLAAAAAACDVYCGWYYVDTDDEIVDETPTDPGAEPMILLGVYEWVKAARAMYASAASEGVQSVKTGALGEQYQGGVGGLSIFRLADRAAASFWSSHVYNLLRAAGVP